MRETDREIRERIEALRLALRGEPREKHRSLTPGGRPAGSPLTVEELDGAREVESRLGRYLMLERDAGNLVDPADLSRGVRELLAGDARETEEIAVTEADPGYIFLDLETTGFASTPLFLAGTMFVKAGRLSCIQLLARDYSEERALVGALDRLIGEFGVCVTFNGKSFDMPYLRERAKYHKLDLLSAPEHLDLLHYARRRWRDILPNCRLATLERHILGRRRNGDVPGWEVPCIYHEFVHTGDARRLVGVIRHNLLDVVSMAELLICLAEA